MSDYDAALAAAAQRYGVPLPLLKGIAFQESGIHPIGATKITPAVNPTALPTGLMQIAPSTARELNIDPNNPAQAIDGGARYLRQGYDRTGNWDDAARYYHGGPDQALWGARTQQYHDAVTQHTQRYMTDAPAEAGQSSPGGLPDAFSRDFGNQGGASRPNPPAAPPASATPSDVPDAFSRDFGPVAGTSVAPQAHPTHVAPDADHPGLLSQIGHGIASLDPGLDAIFNGGNYLRNMQDRAAGDLRGALAVPETMMDAASWVTNHVAGDKKTADTLWRWSQNIDKWAAGLEHNPNSNISKSSEVVGEIGATLPLAEVNILRAGEGANAFAQGLARYGNMSVQGALAGAATSRGEDVGTKMVEGAVGAPLLGGALDVVAPKVIGAIDKVKGAKFVQDMAARLSKALDGETAAAGEARVTAPAAPDMAPLSDGRTIRTGAELADPASRANGAVLALRKDYPEQAALSDKDFIDYFWHSRTIPQETPVVVAASNTTIPPEALGSRGQRTGIEAHDQMPANVADHYRKLTSEGVPPDQALREADITSIGGNPSAASVTREPSTMRAEKEGAKLDIPEGQALSLQAAQNNQALHATARAMVAENGGAPGPGDAMQAAAISLKKASDAAYGRVPDGKTPAPDSVRALYEAADQQASKLKSDADMSAEATRRDVESAMNTVKAREAQEAARAKLEAAQQAVRDARRSPTADVGNALAKVEAARADLRTATENPPTVSAPPAAKDAPGYINLSRLSAALDSPELANPTIEGAKSLRSGVQGLLKAYGGDGHMVNLQQAEKIRQAIGHAYDPMGGGINTHVGRLKSVLDDALDSTEAGPAFRKARATFKDWADKYENPKGVANLIKSDANGNLVGDDTWRVAENLMSSKSDKAFIQIVERLKANGDQSALNHLKAWGVQRAYEAATGRAGGNAVDQLGNSAFCWHRCFHARAEPDTA